ncbi:hypothetical protein [Pseudohalioglobus lutimaris]|uniref:Uncharacterized protein n=1 Tax=Pseudohalioglobus lutimaris TaxID=1737061 RepID=A0A2N5WY16_9GAMM|nr:hypothetical protein [Pseudohalioglobus lutimaris]PLW67130.1 hypothetical protein C0039_18630 [Pseudohalioglobus lutimaris]
MQQGTLLDESFPSRVEAVFADARSARSAAMSLCLRFGLDASQISYFDLHAVPPDRHSNRFKYNASGWTLQKRQIKRTLIAFGIIVLGIVIMHLLHTNGLVSRETAGALLGIPVVAAIMVSVSGMLSWRPAKVGARIKPRDDDEVVLVVEIHDVSQQYELRRALAEMGANTEPGNIAEVA